MIKPLPLSKRRRNKRGAVQPEAPLFREVARFLVKALPVGHPDVFWTGLEADTRFARAQRRRAEIGMPSGLPHVLILARGQLIGIHLRAGEGPVSLEQEMRALAIRRAGGHCHECRSVDQVAATLLGHGIRLAAVDAPAT